MIFFCIQLPDHLCSQKSCSSSYEDMVTGFVWVSCEGHIRLILQQLIQKNQMNPLRPRSEASQSFSEVAGKVFLTLPAYRKCGTTRVKFTAFCGSNRKDCRSWGRQEMSQ